MYILNKEKREYMANNWKKYGCAAAFSIALMSANVYTLLKAFVLSEEIQVVQATNTSSTTEKAKSASTVSSATTQAVITENSYSDENIQITIEEVRQQNTTVYIANIQLSSPEYLKTALAKNTYGTNVTALTSTTASANQAIFAVNGDYYGANSKGYVIKQGVLYRETKRGSSYEDLVVYSDGSLDVIQESSVSAQELLNSGVVHTFAFGPTLVKDGEIAVSTSDEVGRAMADNPRTAIGIIDSLHYIVVVSDGRTSQSEGLTLYELAQLMKSKGATLAYNLDGGGSSTMYFNGRVVNNPTTNGTIKERAVSDIVYIGY